MKDLEQLRTEAFKALTCLYISVPSVVADDVNQKVKAYIDALEEKLGPGVLKDLKLMKGDQHE